MLKATIHYKDKINEMKKILDKYSVKRLHLEDEFFLELIRTINNGIVTTSILDKINPEQTKHYKDITSTKMELMVNIEGIINEMKGKTKLSRYSFGLDIRRVALAVFLTEIKVLVRDKEIKKSDLIIFYDDTSLRIANRGFAITRDEIITNISGIFRVHKFSEMELEPEFVIGLKRDAYRVHLDHTSYDIKVRKKINNTSIAYDVMKLLFKYAQELKKEK